MSHPCMRQNADKAGRISNLATCAKAPVMDTKPGVTREPVKKPTTTADSEATVAIDKSLDDCKELVDMKTELIASGVQCQTMNEEQTKAAYAKMKAEHEAKKLDETAGIMPPPPASEPSAATSTARKSRPKKTDADK